MPDYLAWGALSSIQISILSSLQRREKRFFFFPVFLTQSRRETEKLYKADFCFVIASSLSCPIKMQECLFEWPNEREPGKHERKSMFTSRMSRSPSKFFFASAGVCMGCWVVVSSCSTRNVSVSQPASRQATTSFMLLFVLESSLPPFALNFPTKSCTLFLWQEPRVKAAYCFGNERPMTKASVPFTAHCVTETRNRTQLVS